MKNSLRLLVALALLTSTSAFAQSMGATNPPPGGPHFGPPPGIENAGGAITLPDGTVLPMPTINSDGSITLPDGTVIDPTKDRPEPPMPSVTNADGSITLPDGTVFQLNADGSYTTPDGEVVYDLPPARPAGNHGHGRDHRGPKSNGGS